VATARTGSTRAAADRVARSQSASSAAIASLEAAVGKPLFDRVGRRLLLNEHGRAMLQTTESLLSQAGDLQARMSSDREAPLRIGSSFTIGEYLLPRVLAAWKQDHPESGARVIIGNTSEVIEAVVVIFAAPSHELAGRKAGFNELAGASWVLREPGSGTREASDRLLLERVANMRIELELGSSEAVKRVVAAGVGIGCLSRHAVAEAFAGGWLVEVRTSLPKSPRALSIVVPRERPPGRIAETFVQACLAVGTAV
jgi:DNA-binding transcriptional LysR family regulator